MDQPRGRPADPCPRAVPLVRVRGGRGPAGCGGRRLLRGARL